MLARKIRGQGDDMSHNTSCLRKYWLSVAMRGDLHPHWHGCVSTTTCGVVCGKEKGLLWTRTKSLNTARLQFLRTGPCPHCFKKRMRVNRIRAIPPSLADCCDREQLTGAFSLILALCRLGLAAFTRVAQPPTWCTSRSIAGQA